MWIRRAPGSPSTRVGGAARACAAAATGVPHLAAAAQSSLANLFAGLVISISRPYHVGDWVHLRSSSASGVEADGVVLQIGAMYTTLRSRGQQLTVPNAVAMTAIGRTDRLPVRSA